MADLIVTGGVLIPIDPQRRIIPDGAVAIEAIASSPWARQRNVAPLHPEAR